MSQNPMGPMIRSMAWDLGLPVAAYYALHAAGVSDTIALLAGTLAAGARMIWVAVRSRSLSPFSMIMLAVFGVGLLFTLITGDPRFMLVKASVMSALIGAAFLVTAFRGRPLTLAAQQSFQPARSAEILEAYLANPRIREGHKVASTVWGAGLLAEATLRLILVYTLPVSVMVGLSTVMTIATFGGLMVWQARFVARRTAAAAA